MRELKQYVCEFCGMPYNEKSKAQHCEKGHKKPVKICDCRYLPINVNAKGYPFSISIEMGDGTVKTYKR